MRNPSACVLLFLLLMVPGGPDALAGEGTVGRIQRQYEAISSFQAEFTQELKVAASPVPEERSGVLYYQNPGLIRWETLNPEKELLVVGPEEVWNYFEEEETAYRYPADDVFGSAVILRILSGKARLDEEFLTEEDLSGDRDGRKIRLIPRNPEPSLVEAAIWVDPETFLLRQVLVVDFYGNTNRIVLRDLRLNPLLDPSLFIFTPPEGVVVLEGL